MGSIGIVSLLRLGEIEDFIQFCRNYPVVKVRPVPRDASRAGQTKVEPSSSDPLVGGPPLEAEGHGSGVRHPGHGPGRGTAVCRRGWDPISSDVTLWRR